MIKIALCDDNPSDLSYLTSLMETYLTTYPADCSYSVFHNGFELMSSLEKGKSYDIYCLDIIMPSFNGIDLGKEIRTYDKNAHIIFFTSSPEFALESYSVKAADYVLKPVTQKKFTAVLDDVLEDIQKEPSEAIILKSNEGIQHLLLSSILYVEAMGRNTLYHTVGNRLISCPQSFSAACESLKKYPCFMKPHRSYLVNMNYIDTIESKKIKLHNLAWVPIAQGKIKTVKAEYLAFQMGG